MLSKFVLVLFLKLLLSFHVFEETNPKNLINHHNKYGKYIHKKSITIFRKHLGDTNAGQTRIECDAMPLYATFAIHPLPYTRRNLLEFTCRPAATV